MKRADREHELRGSTGWLILILCAAAFAAGAYFLARLFAGGGIRPLSEVRTLHRGDIVNFGSFEQDGDEKNGAEALPWMVLEVQDERALLLARDVILPVSFHETYAETDWEHCSLREWLNESFQETAFTDRERERILRTELDTPQNPGTDSSGSGPAGDLVFLLSMEEASAYMRTEEERFTVGCAVATDWARKMHLEVEDDSEDGAAYACWWLRTSGSDRYAAVFVDRDGSIYKAGAQVSHETYCGLRPALWVS